MTITGNATAAFKRAPETVYPFGQPEFTLFGFLGSALTFVLFPFLYSVLHFVLVIKVVMSIDMSLSSQSPLVSFFFFVKLLLGWGQKSKLFCRLVVKVATNLLHTYFITQDIIWIWAYDKWMYILRLTVVFGRKKKLINVQRF